jgi:hypothetical protein
MRSPFRLYPVDPNLPRLSVQHVPGTYGWILTAPFFLGATNIPAGFQFDGASIPRLLWWWVRPAGLAFEAACVHDYHYRVQDMDKREADALLYEHCCTYSGGRWIRAYCVWLGVHLFGGPTWRAHAKAKEQ